MIRLLVASGCCMEIAYLTFFAANDPATDVLLLIVVNAFCYLLLALVLFGGKRVMADTAKLNREAVWIILGFALLFRLTLVFHPAVGSDDIFRYLWDGKVSAAGINPFAYSPADERLSHLRTEDLPALMNFPGMRTIYPPLAQMFFQFSSVLFGDSVLGIKCLLVIADIATMLLLLRLLQRRTDGSQGIANSPLPLAFVLYAWSPVPILYVALDGHIDALGIPFLLLFLGLASKGRTVLSSLSLGLSALAKLYPLFIVPFLTRFPGGRKGLWTAAIPILLLAAGYALYAEPTGGAFESLLVYNASFEFNGALFTLVKWIARDGMASRVICGFIFPLWALVLYFRSRSLIETTLLLFLGFLLCSPTAHPWYFTWLAALLPLRWSLSVFVLLGLTNLSNIVVHQYRLTGLWEESAALVAVEYLPFFFLFSRELMMGEWGGESRS